MTNKSNSEGKVLSKTETPPPSRHAHCVEIVGPDRRMDQKGNFDAPVNPLPVKCQQCKFVDLDFVHESYALYKGIDNPVEFAPAEVGNFLVRERVRGILEVVAPGQCSFHPTQDSKTKQPTPWLLAVPKEMHSTGIVKPSIKRCPECNEPSSAHGTQYEKRHQVSSSPFEVFKSLNWISIGEKAPDYSQKYFRDCVDHRHALALDRELYFSVRLEKLLKTLAIRGMCRSITFSVKPTPEDLAWVQAKLRLVEGLSAQSSSAEVSRGSEDWFNAYLKKCGKKKPKLFDFAAIERAHGFKLPPDYKEFVAKVGGKTFRNMDGEDGFNVRILLPEELDFQQFRNTPSKDAGSTDDDRIDGVIFATTEHGDVLCFDVTKRNGEYAIYLYDHEMDDFEPFTTSFAACIKRLTRV